MGTRLWWRGFLQQTQIWFEWALNRAGTEKGFLVVLCWLRVMLVSSLLLRFGLAPVVFATDAPISHLSFDVTGFLREAIRPALILYFFINILWLFQALKRLGGVVSKFPGWLEFVMQGWSPQDIDKAVQVVVDIGVITLAYLATGDPQSYILLFYFCPFLIVARYFNLRAFFFFLLMTVVPTVGVGLSVMSPTNFANPIYWVETLFSRIVFLCVLMFFYGIYYRRRSMAKGLEQVEKELSMWFHDIELSPAVAIVNEDMRVSGINDVMRHWYGANLIDQRCQQAFCHKETGDRRECEVCPLAIALRQEQPVSNVDVRFIDRRGEQFQARVSAIPVFDRRHTVVGVAALVQNKSAHHAFTQRLQEYETDVERTVEAQTEEYRTQTEVMARRLAAVLRASSAMLLPDQHLRLDEILRSITSLLKSHAADVRKLEWDSSSGKSRLRLIHSYGYTEEEAAQRKYLDLDTKSIVVNAFLQGVALQDDDVQTSGSVHFLAMIRNLGLHALATFPLTVGDEHLGTISTYRKWPQKFSPEEMELGQALANQLATALLSRDLISRIQAEKGEREKALESLSRLSRQLTKPLGDLQTLSQSISDSLKETLNAQRTEVQMLDGSGLYRTIAFAGEVTEQNMMLPETTTQLVEVPLVGHEGNFGRLRALNKIGEHGLDKRGFIDSDVRLMTTIACLAAVVLENAQRLAEQNFLMEVGRMVTSSLDRNEILPKSLEQALVMLDAEAGSILMPDKRDGALVFQVTAGLQSEFLEQERLPKGRGIAGRVYELGKPILVADVRQDPSFDDEIDRRIGFKTRSLVSVPIKTRDGIVGVIEVVNKRHGTFFPMDMNLLTKLSDWIAIAIDNAYLYEAAQGRQRFTEALNESMAKLSSTLDLPVILDDILGQLKCVVNYSSASLWMRDGDRLMMWANAGFTTAEQEKLRITPLPITNKPFQSMLATQQPCRIPDVHKQPDLDAIVGTERIRSWIGAPLIFQGRVIGQLSVDNWEPDQYDSEDEAKVMAFAQHAAVAIRNADLFEEQKKWSKHLLSVSEDIVDMTQVRDLPEQVDRVAQAVIDLLGCEISGVAIYNEDNEEVHCLPGKGYRGVSDGFANSFRFSLKHDRAKILQTDKIYVIEDAKVKDSHIFWWRWAQQIGARRIMAKGLKVSGQTVGVLYAADRQPRNTSENEKTTFELLANQAALVIRSAQLREESRRYTELQILLQQISVVGQRTSNLDVILNIVLTGVTAGYGLRFNRALLMLTDETGKYLVGRTGIGQLDRKEADAIWKNLQPADESFESYVREVLTRGVPVWTTLHHKSKDLRIPIETESQEIFSRGMVNKQARVIDPAAEDILINNDFFRLMEPGPFALIPLMVEDHVVGMLVADNKFTNKPITESDLTLLKACASQVAAAIERAELTSDLISQVEVLKRMQEASQHMSDLADLREVVQRVVEDATLVFEADSSYLAPYDYETDELVVELAASHRENEGFEHSRTFSKQGLTHLVMSDPSGLVVVEGLATRPDLKSQYAESQQVKSLAVVRLESHNRTVGVLYVNYQQPHHFTPQDRTMLRMFAAQAATAMRNAMLMDTFDQEVTRRERDRLRYDLHETFNTLHYGIMSRLEQFRNRMIDLELTDEAISLDRLWRFTKTTYDRFRRIHVDMKDLDVFQHETFKAESGGLIKAIEIVRDAYAPLIKLIVKGEARPSSKVEWVLYQIYMEAIANVMKHASLPLDADEQVITELVLEPTYTKLTVQDFGVGFAMGTGGAPAGIGFQIVGKYAKKIGATHSIESSPNRGTRIEVYVPLKETRI